jgi:hypothetical protein
MKYIIIIAIKASNLNIQKLVGMYLPIKEYIGSTIELKNAGLHFNQKSINQDNIISNMIKYNIMFVKKVITKAISIILFIS